MSRPLPIALISLLSLATSCSGDGEIELLGSGGAAGSPGSCADGCPDGEEPHCNTVTGRCVQCLDQSHCSLGEICDAPTGECLDACSATEPCTSGDRPICDPNRQVCVQCQSDANCSEERPRCDTATGFCVECLTSSDCVDPVEPLCKPLEYECSAG